MRSLSLLSVLGLVFGIGCGSGGSAPMDSTKPSVGAKDAARGNAKDKTDGRDERQLAKLKAMAPAADQEPAAKGQAAEKPAEVARKIIYTADIELVVEEFEDAERRIGELVKESKGYISSSDVSGSPGSRRHGQWTVRIPVERFDAFRDALAGLGELHRNHLDSRDVTEEFYDLQANIKNKQVEEERLIKHLKDSTGNLKDILAVEAELTRVRGEIERQQGRLNYLARLTALTTVTIAVQERKDYVAPTSPTFATSVSRTFEDSAGALLELGKGIVILIVALVPWVPVIALVVIPPWLLIRRRLRRDLAPILEVKPVLPAESPQTPAGG